MKPLGKIKIGWSPDMAYVIGLITSDGCLSNDGRHIDFTSKDVQLLNTFKDILGINVKIGYKISGYTGKVYTRVQFGDINFYRWLENIGLTPKKSKTISGLNIPDKYFFDFLRGLFDGDDSFYSYWDDRWPNSFVFYMSFVSASEDFIIWLREKLGGLLYVKGAVQVARGLWMLRFAKQESLKIINKMYYSNNIPCLIRKRDKIKLALKEAGVA